MGLATINEISKEHNWKWRLGDFIELKLLDNGLSASDYSDWSVGICHRVYACTLLPMSGFTRIDSYLVNAGSETWGYVEWTDYFDVHLYDGDFKTIDYLSIDGHSAQAPSCTLPYDTTASTGSSTRRIKRLPDGTGNWNVPSGNSQPATEGENNTDIPANAVTLSISDATTPQGSNMVFNLSLPANVLNVVISYTTFNGSALGGTDYTSSTGTLTIPAGTTTGSITVPTLVSGATLSQNFYVILNSVTNAAYPDQGAIGTITVPVIAVDHYRFEYDGSGLTCATEPVVLKACANADCSSLYTGTAMVTAGASTPAPGSTTASVDSSFVGSATFNFAETMETTLTLSLLSKSPSAPVVCYENGVADANCDYKVEDTGFLFFNENNVAPEGVNEIVNQLSNKPSNVGYKARNYSFQAVQTDTTTGVCAPLFADGVSVEMEVTYECVDPSNCSGDPVSLFNNGNTLVLGKLGTTSDHNIQFGADSKADFSFIYPEAGQIRLHLSKSIELSPTKTTVMTGTSNSFVVRPFGLKLDMNSEANAYATDASGSVFKKTGEAFTVNATAARWVNGEDEFDEFGAAGADGQPDANVNINDNDTAANFSGVTLKLTHSVTHPIGGAPGTLSGNLTTQAFNASVATINNTKFNEVGVIRLNAQLQQEDYLGAGNIYGNLANVGRFVPDHFNLSNGLVAKACVNFSYMDQPFNVSMTLEAQNSSGDPTVNYTGAHAKASLVFVAENNNTGVDFGARLTGLAANWTAGAIDSPMTTNFARATAPLIDGPYDNLLLGLQIDDGEVGAEITLSNTADMNATTTGVCAGASCNAVTIDANETLVRYGRLKAENSFGPLGQSLTVPIYAEYFNGTTFVLSNTDSCSVIAANAIDLSGTAISPFAGSTNVLNITTDAVAGSTSAVTDTNTQSQATQGIFDLTLSSPTLVGVDEGYVPIIIDATLYPWLRFDWDGDDTVDDVLPTVRATFGQFRGNDRVIYWREKK